MDANMRPDTDNVNMDILGPVIEEAKRKAREAASRNGQQEPGPEHDPPESEPQDQRQVVLTAASEIIPRRVQWLWDARIALGTLALLAGREGLGKSILSYTIAAMITRGMLPGEFYGEPKSVLVAAAEDSWSQTIVPRLIAADADLDRVFRVEVVHDTIHSELSMPRDLARVKAVAREVDAVLMILDPLISRLDPKLDSHKDADVRRALEPLVAMADVINISVLGLIHHNKSGATDPLQVVMASKAFPAVARSVHTVIPDPDDETSNRRLFGTPKNNLGRVDLPTLSFVIESFALDVEDGTASTGRLVWGDEAEITIYEAMRRCAESPDEKSATVEAAEWLEDYLALNQGRAASAKIKIYGASAGHSYDSLKRARRMIGSAVESSGFPRRTFWLHPKESRERQSEQQ
jgi:AAA domain